MPRIRVAAAPETRHASSDSSKLELNALLDPNPPSLYKHMRRYRALHTRVVDEVGEDVCACRDTATAEWIADALNRAEPATLPWPYNALLRPERLVGATLEWPEGPLIDEPIDGHAEVNTRTPTILALDLEGTLISNAVSQIPRPGLFAFLTECKALFRRLVIFTTVSEERFRPIARLLVDEGKAPAWFADIEYINWHGGTKDLRFIPDSVPQDVLLVDDLEAYIHPEQRSQWIEARYFGYPYSQTDVGLWDVLRILNERVTHGS